MYNTLNALSNNKFCTRNIAQVFNRFLSWGNSLVLHCASLLRTIFASSARAHGRVHVQNVRDYSQTKLHSEINSLFLLNEHGDPRCFFQVFAKNSLMKNIFEEEKKFDSRTWFFLEKSPLLDVFWPRPGLQANHGTVRKSATKQPKTA